MSNKLPGSAAVLGTAWAQAGYAVPHGLWEVALWDPALASHSCLCGGSGHGAPVTATTWKAGQRMHGGVFGADGGSCQNSKVVLIHPEPEPKPGGPRVPGSPTTVAPCGSWWDTGSRWLQQEGGGRTHPQPPSTALRSWASSAMGSGRAVLG